MRRLDPVGLAVAVLAAAVFLLHGFDGELSRDLALYAYAGQRVADGVAPYVGVMNRSGPLAHLVPRAGAWAGDLVRMDDVLAIRVLLMVISVLVVWATYALCREVFGSRLVGATAGMFVGTLPAFILYAVGGPRDKTIMMLFLTVSLLATVRHRWAAAGACLALATLTWQPAFLPGAATVVVAALTTEGLRGSALRKAGAAGALTSLVFVVGFAAAGALPDALDGFIRIHLSATYQPGFRDDPRANWEASREAYGIAAYVLVAGLAALPILAMPGLMRLARRGTTPPHRADVVIVAATAGEMVGLAWSYRTFNGWADALVLVPFAALGLAGVTALLVRRLPWPAGTAVAVAACLTLLTSGVHYATTQRSPVLLEQTDEVTAVMDILPASSMLSIEAPQSLVLSHSVNPSRHQMFRLGLETYVDCTWPGGLAGYAEWISATRPTIVTVGAGAHYEWLVPMLRADYVRFGTSPGWYWYVDRSIDHDTLARLEEAVGG